MDQKVALVTGASSGIGAATAGHLRNAGYLVYAGARRVERMQTLADSGIKVKPLDVTEDASMTSVMEEIIDDNGRIDVLVNNAGYGSYGAVEDVPLSEGRYQLEVNLFGPARLSQLAIPHMRAAGGGKIVNVSSMGGHFGEPLGAWYHASKFAVEGFSDSLRLELHDFGIDVIVIEPGLIKTRFGETAAGSIEGAATGDGIYADFNAAVAKTTSEAYDGPFARLGGGPDTVARKIEKAISKRRPKTRYPVTASAHLVLFQRRWMSDRFWDRFVGTQFPEPAKLRNE
jgi:short-subunit dehydrogenase